MFGERADCEISTLFLCFSVPMMYHFLRLSEK